MADWTIVDPGITRHTELGQRVANAQRAGQSVTVIKDEADTPRPSGRLELGYPQRTGGQAPRKHRVSGAGRTKVSVPRVKWGRRMHGRPSWRRIDKEEEVCVQDGPPLSPSSPHKAENAVPGPARSHQS